MHKIIDEAGSVYRLYTYTKEIDFEKMIVSNVEAIFGKTGIYFDVKKLIGIPKKGGAIPDGYYLDLIFHDDPRLYIVEVELNSHDVYGHIGEQILRFGIASETDKYKMKNLLLDEINNSSHKKKTLDDFFEKSKYNNYNELLDKVIFDNKPAAIVIIDKATEELFNVMGQLTMMTEVIEAQTYICGNRKLYRFTPFKDDILTDMPVTEDADELDTIIVPAREDGFQEQFLRNNCWFAVRISAVMMDKIKYIAGYQVAPVSGITHIAEIKSIEKYQDTNKYIVYFKDGTLRKIDKIGLGKKRGRALQGPRYSSYKAVMRAKSLDDIWN